MRRNAASAERSASASARSKVMNQLLATAVGQVEQRLLGNLDLRTAVELRFGAEGVVDDRFAEIDELAAQPGIVDGTAVFARVDDANHRGQQLREKAVPPTSPSTPECSNSAFSVTALASWPASTRRWIA